MIRFGIASRVTAKWSTAGKHRKAETPVADGQLNHMRWKNTWKAFNLSKRCLTLSKLPMEELVWQNLRENCWRYQMGALARGWAIAAGDSMIKKADEANSTEITGQHAAILLYLIDMNAGLSHQRSSQENTKLTTEEIGRKNTVWTQCMAQKKCQRIKREEIFHLFIS